MGATAGAGVGVGAGVGAGVGGVEGVIRKGVRGREERQRGKREQREGRNWTERWREERPYVALKFFQEPEDFFTFSIENTLEECRLV